MGNIKTIDIPYGTPGWHEFRLNGIGGSECSVLFGFQDKYSCPAKLYNQKIGRYPIEQIDNEAMFWGRELESQIITKWQYYDGRNPYIENYSKGEIKREAKRWDGFIVNDDYPHLFASIDGYFENGFSLLTGEEIPMGIVECKTITSQSSAHWKNGIPPGYIFQVHQYMIILEVKYAEIVLLKDGRNLDVLPIEYNQRIGDQIKETTYNFWNKRVLPGRKAYTDYLTAERIRKVDLASKYMYEVDKLEPEGDGSEGHKEFENERWKEKSNRSPGDTKNRNRLMLDKKYLQLQKILETQREKNIQMVRRDLRLSDSDYFEWDDGYARVYQRGKSVVFDNRLKFYPDETELLTAFRNLMRDI